MTFITIDSEKCNQDGLCVQSCPVAIIDQKKGGFPFADTTKIENCIACGHCVAVCPKGALTHSLLSSEDFLTVPKNQPDPESLEALLISRRSIRGFQNMPIPHHQLERLLEISRRAPTASNSQKISWNMIESSDRLEQIRQLTLEWLATDPTPTRAHYLETATKGRDVILRGASALAVTYCPEDYVWTETDCSIALTYMELLAASMQLGACWAGLVTMASRHLPQLKEILGIPERHNIGGALMLGLPRQKHYLIPPRNKAHVTWL
ncbi:nitroreductase family protein [Desulfogranum japonicum]|uniref:nitroreductase family protein n=1 Tax=Desulfogranum japonicum TaxID=231447 RepID=UPI00041AD12C|nr:nitroreductase family protein [Desulfogranum japonicum]